MSPGWLIGGISLLAKPDDNRAFWLDPAWQGQRLMSEASAGVADFWFERLGRPVLRVQKAAANRMSGRGAGYPAPPPQIPPCSFPAVGSRRRSNAILGLDATIRRRAASVTC
jgi:hypothetical protein